MKISKISTAHGEHRRTEFRLNMMNQMFLCEFSLNRNAGFIFLAVFQYLQISICISIDIPMPDFIKPRNIVTRSGGILRGMFSSIKYNKGIKWEGPIEKDIVPIFEFSHLILDAISQPFRSNFVIDGVKTSRTPDFLVFTSEEEILIECKAWRQLQDPTVVNHLKIAREHFESLGYRYFIASDQLIRKGHALNNARELLSYRMRTIQSNEETNRIFRQFNFIKERFAAPTFLEAVQCSKSKTDVFVMMASGLIYFNFQDPIQDNTQLSFSQLPETHDAASFLFC